MAQSNGTAAWVRWALGFMVIAVIAIAGTLMASIAATDLGVDANQKEIAANRAAIASLTATMAAVKADTAEIKADVKALRARRAGG